MPTPDEQPLDHLQESPYSVHALSALDGVLLHVVSGGETVGSFFGPTEEAAAAAFAAHVTQAVTITDEGESR